MSITYHSLRLLFVAICCTLAISAAAQKSYELKPDFGGQGQADFDVLKDLPLVWVDSSGTESALATLILRLRGAGYLTASADNIAWQDNQLVASIAVGPVFEWAEIDDSSVDEFMLAEANLNLHRKIGKKLLPADLLKLEEKLLQAATNNGYPFAKVTLDSLAIEENGIKGKLKLEKGSLFTFGGIRLIDPVNISEKYLQQYLGVPVGSVYDKSKIEAIPNRIKELPFVTAKRNPTVSFIGKQAVLNLFLTPKKASRWDAILGYLPRTNSLDPNENEKDLFTLSLLADMNNQLGLGERIFFQFEQLQPQRQELDIKINYPYAFGLPFGANGEFSIYRRDSSFTDINSELGLQYLFSGNNFIKVFWENRVTNLAKIDTLQVLLSKQLPAQLDTRNALFGIEWQFQKLNYRFNPRSGWAAKLRTGFGLKNIQENNRILELERDGFSPRMLYDSLSEQSWQIRMEATVEKYFPIGKSGTIKTAARLGTILAEADIFRNEQYRIGGNSFLRGFDEESFNAETYAVSTLEYRLLISTNSALFVFCDVGYVGEDIEGVMAFDTPVGIGSGITFETGVGIFGFSLAVGRQKDTPFDVRKVKTHFGYVSLF